MRRSGRLDFLKVSFVEAVGDAYENREGEWEDPDSLNEGKERNARLNIVAFGGIVLLVMALGALYLRFSPSPSLSSLTGQEVASVEGAEVRLSEFVEDSSMEELQDAALEAIRGFMEAESLADSTAFLVGGDQQLPLLQDYYGRPENRFPKGFQKVVKVVPNAIAEFFYFAIFAADHDEVVHQFIALESGDQMRVDWACSVSYGELSYHDFSAQKPEKSQKMRFMIQPEVVKPTKGPVIQLEELDPSEFDDEFDREDPQPFALLTDLNGEIQFRAKIAPEAQKCMDLLKALHGRKMRLPVQLRLVWDQDGQYPKVTALDHLWWFDYPLLAKSEPPIDWDQ